MGPLMLEANRIPNIDIMTMSEVVEVTGYVGNFEAKIRKNPRYVDEVLCNGCGSCAEVCPVFTSNFFDEHFSVRKAIDGSFAQAVPITFTVDLDACIHCYACVEACELNALNFSQEPEVVEKKFGTVIVATGWDLWKPPANNVYGYGVFENVVTQVELERLLAPNGPNLGHLKRPSDKKHPKRVLFIQCVGSRSTREGECSWCSNVCCLLAIKNSKLIKSEIPDAEIVVTYMDMRPAGKEYEEYFRRSRDAGIIYNRGVAVDAREDPVTKNVTVTFESQGSGDMIEFEADLVVLSPASLPSAGTGRIARVMKLERSPSGFLKEYHSRLNPIDTKVPGIFICGSAQGQKAIDATVNQARGAASSASVLMSRKKYEIDLIRAMIDGDSCSRCHQCVSVCPFNAISVLDDGSISVDVIMCKGCGCCVAACRSHSVTLRYYRDLQYDALIDGLLGTEIEIGE
ncbi:MAG: 4Fe-4S binding protein [Promethearchaeota archaeon]